LTSHWLLFSEVCELGRPAWALVTSVPATFDLSSTYLMPGVPLEVEPHDTTWLPGLS
jgi:hypothetical protein